MKRTTSLHRAVSFGIGLTLLAGLAGCASGQSGVDETRKTLNPQSGLFAPCPDSPNCVSTQADDEEHAIAPLSYSGSRAEAKQRILDIVSAMPRTRIVAEEENYLRAEFRSRIFRFVDDVEFYFDDNTKTIQFRSASRLGYSDMGVNRKRMEEISTQFEE